MKQFNILIIILLLTPFHISAQDGLAGCVVSSKKTYVKISGNRRVITDSVEMTVLDRRGESFTSFAFQYSKGDKVSVDYAVVTDMSGKVVRKLKNSDIKETQYIPNATLYHDEFIKYFDLRHNSYPYKISYCVTYTLQRFMHIGHLSPEGRCGIDNGTYTVEVPAGYRLKYTARNIGEPDIKNNAQTDKYVWQYKYRYSKPEINEAPVSDTAPYLEIVPESFVYGVAGGYDSWERLGRWAWELNDGLCTLPDSEKARIDAMLEGVADQREKVRILYHYLQDYNRYVNVKINLGGFKSYPAEYVCRNRFGDCKALSNYMRAILAHAGIEAHYTLANLDDTVPYFDESFPSNVFNHIIAVVPLATDTIFLECTSKNSPFNYVGTSNQARKALVTKRSGSHLVDVPAMTAADTECIYRFRVQCPDSRSSAISLDAKLRGPEFERFAFLASGANKNDVDIYLRNYTFGKTFQMSEYTIDRPHRDSTFLNLSVKGTNPEFYRVFGQTVILNSISMGLPAYELPAERKTAVQIDLPLNNTMIVEYELTGVVLTSAPAGMAIESPYGAYEAAFKLDGAKLTVTKRLTMNAGTIPLDEYPAFYDFVAAVRNHENSKYQITVQ